MIDRIALDFTLTKDEMSEGIAVASNALLLPWQRRAVSAALLVIALLAGAGAMGLFIWAYTANLGHMPPFYVGPIVFLLVGGFGLGQYGVQLGWMSTNALAFDDNTGTHITVDAAGLHVQTTHEDRRLGWPAVFQMTHGKTAIFMLVGGAAFILPNRALDDPKAAFAQMQTWHKVSL